MRATSIIFRRELGAYFRSPIGWVIAALVLFVQGLLFQSQALGAGKNLSAVVLSQFFMWASGPTVVAAIALAMRLVAEERQNGTIMLLNTSPVRDVEIVAGKFLAAYAFLTFITLLSVYMPLLILVRGKISFGHVAVGYLGLLLIGGASLAIGMFGTAMTRHQLVAAVVAGVIVGALYLMWPLSQVVDPPLKDVVAALSFHVRHFSPFMQGTLHLRDVAYYLALMYFFLLLATKMMEARRWQ